MPCPFHRMENNQTHQIRQATKVVGLENPGKKGPGYSRVIYPGWPGVGGSSPLADAESEAASRSARGGECSERNRSRRGRGGIGARAGPMSRAGFVPREKHPPPRDPHVRRRAGAPPPARAARRNTRVPPVRRRRGSGAPEPDRHGAHHRREACGAVHGGPRGDRPFAQSSPPLFLFSDKEPRKMHSHFRRPSEKGHTKSTMFTCLACVGQRIKIPGPDKPQRDQKKRDHDTAW